MAMRTFTHLYDDFQDAQRTVEALQTAGVPHDDISIVSNNADSRHGATAAGASGTGDVNETRAGTGASTGTLVGGGIGLLTGLGLLAIPGVGPVVAAGWLIATATGAGIGAAGGGLLGSLVHAGVPEGHAHAYAEGVRRGGTLVTVRGEESQADRIESVLNGRMPAAVDMTARRTDYQTDGWEKFDDNAPHYTAEQLSAERAKRSAAL
ncbi:general stress protein [Lichenicoccus sp.]|uniref:general stress protein n=1 Tax=Lichenicoccus sp. TaxID=2781899 RepID=UPI003D12FEA2